MVAATGVAEAQNCKSDGGLRYLGNAADASESVWLSGTVAGSFELEAAQQSQVVDQWSLTRSGLHVSRSPVVSSGNGGTHKLYATGNGKPCLIDTQNQKGGITLPPNITLPGIVLPPIGNLFPDFQLPSLPGGATPPIGNVPIGGLMPTRPGALRPPSGVTPPVGTVPPTGVMPTRPGALRPPLGVTPPIGTVPPSGVMPTRPPGTAVTPIATLPPTGVMPTRPGALRPPSGVTPPIGTRPPAGVMPTRPPGTAVTPIATLPPTGVMPTRPGALRPPSGVTPPIGTVPPTGVTPTRPPVGGLTPTVPPTGGRPTTPTQPPTGLTPTVPTAPDRPGGVAPGAVARGEEGAALPEDPCFDVPRDDEDAAETEARRRDCLPALLEGPPLTTGRDLAPPSLWNAWSDAKLVGVSDRRFGLDMDSLFGSAAIGIDRKVRENLIVGVSLSFDQGRTTGYDGTLEVNTRGVSIGPYAALRLSEHWATDASLSFGQVESDLRLSVLDGSYTTRQVTGTVNLYGQYLLRGFFLRPKVGITYAYMNSDAYDLAGTVRGRAVRVGMPSDAYNYGVATVSAEVSRLYVLDRGTYLMPFAELGVDYEYERPGDGEILTGDLQLATSSPWAGSLEAGARMLFSNALQVETSAAYRSFGQANLDIWEGHLNVSIAF
ncbi:autotransporter domain-containing protein [Amorphus suaedae]